MDAQFRDTISKRYPLLQALEQEPNTKAGLVDIVDSSRSTIDRAIDGLLEIGCVEPTEPGARTFRLTPTGKVAFQIEKNYRSDAGQVQENSALLNSLPSDAPLSNAFLSNAEIHFSPRTPDIAFKPGAELLKEADRMRGTATVVRTDYFEILRDRIETGGLNLELVAESELLAAIEENYEAEFRDLATNDSVTVYTIDQPLPYALWLTDRGQETTAGITIHEDGGVKGTIVNDADSALAWAQAQYADYLKAATRIETPTQ